MTDEEWKNKCDEKTVVISEDDEKFPVSLHLQKFYELPELPDKASVKDFENLGFQKRADSSILVDGKPTSDVVNIVFLLFGEWTGRAMHKVNGHW